MQILLFLLLITAVNANAQEVGISLGEETVTIQKSLVITSIRNDDLNIAGEQKFCAEYLLNNTKKSHCIGGYEYYDFYMNKWTDARAVLDLIAEKEGLSLGEIDLETAEYQMTAGLPLTPEEDFVPEEPIAPEEPVVPTEPEQPVVPEQPSAPEEPVVPSEPGEESPI